MTKRGFFVLLLIVALGFGAAFLSKRLLQGPPSEWLCHEYSLTPGRRNG